MAMMGFFTSLASIAAPLFLIASPILSYSDQALSMHRAKSSAGFSLDIPLIMLVASIVRIFYYPGAKYDVALLIQSFCNIFMQVILLKIALDHRPAPSSRGGDAAIPFSGSQGGLPGLRRPYNFWQWRSSKPYWQFLLCLFIALAALELLIAPFDSIYPTYSALTGYVGLSVEATLPLPQLYANAQSKSCKGFRFSVLASWIAGDSMKMFWFFTATAEIPLAFKLCGIFQAICDALIGVQYFIYGNRGPLAKSQQKDWELAGKSSSSNGWQTPIGRRTPMGEKSY
ncbi:hypothetical protein F4824DRAFT_164001 [Ustulina deusta]|nr:hypothetical protein F4824DRAFT_164001 [Ustulina deusta]